MDDTPWILIGAAALGVYYYARRATTPTVRTTPRTAASTVLPTTAVNQALATPASPPAFAVPVPSGINLALSVLTAHPEVGQPVTVEGLAQGLAAYNAQLIDFGRIGTTAQWTWVFRSPSGTVAQYVRAPGGGTSLEAFTPSSPGRWTVLAWADVRGFVTGPGIMQIPVA